MLFIQTCVILIILSSSNDILEDAQSTLIYVCGYNCGHQHIGIVQYKWTGVGCQELVNWDVLHKLKQLLVYSRF